MRTERHPNPRAAVHAAVQSNLQTQKLSFASKSTFALGLAAVLNAALIALAPSVAAGAVAAAALCGSVIGLFVMRGASAELRRIAGAMWRESDEIADASRDVAS